MMLGGGIDPQHVGKFLDKDHICLKPTVVENMFPVDKDLNMMVRRIQDEYPKYVKDSTTGQISFAQQIGTKINST